MLCIWSISQAFRAFVTIWKITRIFLTWFWPLSGWKWFRLKIGCYNILISGLGRFGSGLFQSFRLKYRRLLKRFLLLNFSKIFILVIIVIVLKVPCSRVKPRRWVLNHFNRCRVNTVKSVMISIAINIALIIALFWWHYILFYCTMIWLLFVS